MNEKQDREDDKRQNSDEPEPRRCTYCGKPVYPHEQKFSDDMHYECYDSNEPDE